jgi:hypothetical protein
MIMRGERSSVYSFRTGDRITGWASDFSLDPLGDMGYMLFARGVTDRAGPTRGTPRAGPLDFAEASEGNPEGTPARARASARGSLLLD